MKLAEALLERKNLKIRIDSLRNRAYQNALIQEGDEVTEDPSQLLAEANDAALQMGLLIQRINATNNVTRLESGLTLADAIVERDMLDLRRQNLDFVLNRTAIRQDRVTRTEIKYVPTIDVAKTRREVDHLAQQRRELDAQIQAANWTAELIDEQA